ncbi:hypothetical protein B296_00028260 [Ensete ventricosum]|uniref:Uncharacterized protein n=1 Tax=Ensete ventricosum TaxID=4639 RepID=A0A426ZIC0_ENSVE|nr:hypothetical protein B296_00028260 [Ensete ventricosum]
MGSTDVAGVGLPLAEEEGRGVTIVADDGCGCGEEVGHRWILQLTTTVVEMQGKEERWKRWPAGWGYRQQMGAAAAIGRGTSRSISRKQRRSCCALVQKKEWPTAPSVEARVHVN